MYAFCTYFDSRYLAQGLALYQSLQQHCSAFELWVLCLDRSTYTTLTQRALPNMRLIALEELEQDDPALRHAKTNRTLVEYYFTCTPSLPLFIFAQRPNVEFLTYLDADLFFFADPEPVFAEIADHSIAISAHRFPSRLRHLHKYGIYNVGWLSFRADQNGMACLRRWRAQCLDWCYDRVEPDRYADQKYLDDWGARFDRVCVLQHKGANLAPWNLDNYRIQAGANHIWIDEQPLIFFHYQGLKRITRWWYNSNSAHYGTKLSAVVRKNIYGPYIRALAELTNDPRHANALRDDLAQLPNRRQSIEKYLRLARGFFSHKYIFIVNGRVL